jgi:hypothetical protein
VKRLLFLCVCAVVLAPAPAGAAPLMPSFATAPTAWVTYRYQPDVFTNVGTYAGRSDVLGIGISSDDALNNRPPAYQMSLYNTQGMQYAVSGGAGSSVSADLFIEAAWRDEAAGTVRTDISGIMTNAVNQVTGYPIIGFTNYGGTARYRVFDDQAGWIDMLDIPVSYGGWTSFSMTFTGSSIDFTINGRSVYSDTGIWNSTGFSAAIVEAYNFGGDRTYADAFPVDYMAHWANTPASDPVPEPGSMLLFGTGLAGLARAWKRRQ